MSNWKNIFKAWAFLVPEKPVTSVVEWARRNVRLVGSARSEQYDPDITPWTKEPIECAANGTRKMTFVKPVQSGGSDVGEIAIYFWISTQHGGDIQYNWQNDKKSDERWLKRVEKRMKACSPLMSRTSTERFKWNKGLVIFPHCNFTMQGVLSDMNVASDSVRFQVNEELHDDSATSGWGEDGRLDQAYARCTAYWNSVIFNISNAGKRGGQLHKAFEAGTNQAWEVKCPGCGLYHIMRTRWEDDKPHLGGLRYGGDSCRREDGTMDYFRLQSTIRYQMPCGYLVHDVVTERRALSLSGRYCEPRNTGALLTERSYTLEAVAVDYIPWIDLIKQKEEALKTLKWGDGDAWWTYLRERECQFTSPGDRPIMQRIVLSAGRKKDREGLPNRVVRFGAADYQHGLKQRRELPHWWHVIMDVAIEQGRIHALIVSEGKMTTDANLVDVFKRHQLVPSCGALDSGWNADHVYALAMEHGFYVVKDEPTSLFAGHDDGGRKIYSPPKPLHTMMSLPPKYDYRVVGKGDYMPDPNEPMFIHVSKFGMLDRVSWMRSSSLVHFEVPSDVSQDFIGHMDAWQVEERENPRNPVEKHKVWVQRRDDDHMLKCVCYIAVLMEDAGIFSGMILPETNSQEKPQ